MYALCDCICVLRVIYILRRAFERRRRCTPACAPHTPYLQTHMDHGPCHTIHWICCHGAQGTWVMRPSTGVMAHRPGSWPRPNFIPGPRAPTTQIPHHPKHRTPNKCNTIYIKNIEGWRPTYRHPTQLTIEEARWRNSHSGAESNNVSLVARVWKQVADISHNMDFLHEVKRVLEQTQVGWVQTHNITI